MERDKPEAMFPQVFEFRSEQSHSPEGSETQHGPTPDVEEPFYAEERQEKRERRGETLWRVLTERQINMIAFSGTIGNGLFLGSGHTVALAGPGGALLAYALMGTVISAVMSCLGEMTALMPVNAPMMEFPRRFLDRGFGFAVGWMYWFAYCTSVADQLTAVTNLIRFKYEDEHTSLNWAVGGSVDPAIWMTLFLILMVICNMLPVKYFGELDYLFGCIKLAFISMLSVLMLILAVKTPSQNAHYTQTLGTKNWQAPHTFFRNFYQVKDDNGNPQRFIHGSTGRFLGAWLGTINGIFSFTGMDIFAATAAESKKLGDCESMKMAARKISLRIVTIYCVAVFAATLVVPADHPFLNGQGTSVSSNSMFIIAVVEAGYPTAAHFFNGIFVLSAFTCGINGMYVASRVLYALALRDQTGPMWITQRLKQCRNGVPTRAVLASAFLPLLGYMGRNKAPSVVLNHISLNCTVTDLIIYSVICATYLSFFKILEDVKNSGNFSDAQAASYDRNHPRYPYKSHGQWLKGGYGMVACLILILFNGVNCFLERPFGVTGFLISYISIPVFLLLVMIWKFHRHGFNVSEWGPERSSDLSGTIQAASEKRKGRLEFPDDGLTKENALTFLKWIWVWTK